MVFIAYWYLPRLGVAKHGGLCNREWGLGGERKLSFLLPLRTCPPALPLLPRRIFSPHLSQDGASVPTQNVPAMHRTINFFLTNILIHLASFSRLRSLMFMFKLLFTNWVWNGLHIWWLIHLQNPCKLECNPFQPWL